MKLKRICAMAVKFLSKFIHLNNAKYQIIRLTHTKNHCLLPELEQEFNNQIKIEFCASFVYLAMATFFGRRNVSLPGCYQFFLNQVFDEREHAHKLINYLNRRGNVVVLKEISAPINQAWDTPLAAFKNALELENHVSEKIFQLHKLSSDLNDISACSLLETEFVDTQVEEFDKISRYVLQLEKIGNDESGIFLFDKYLLKDVKKDQQIKI